MDILRIVLNFYCLPALEWLYVSSNMLLEVKVIFPLHLSLAAHHQYLFCLNKQVRGEKEDEKNFYLKLNECTAI